MGSGATDWACSVYSRLLKVAVLWREYRMVGCSAWFELCGSGLNQSVGSLSSHGCIVLTTYLPPIIWDAAMAS